MARLLDIDDYKVLMGLSKTDQRTPDDLIEANIDAASALVESYCNRKILLESVSEVFDGTGTAEYHVRQARFASDTTQTVQWWNGSSWETTTGTTVVDNDKGLIYFSDGGVFWSGTKNWKIAYTCGWALVDIPKDLKVTIAQMVRRAILRSQSKEGVASETFGDQSTSFDLTMLSGEIKERLQPYRFRGGLG